MGDISNKPLEELRGNESPEFFIDEKGFRRYGVDIVLHALRYLIKTGIDDEAYQILSERCLVTVLAKNGVNNKEE